MPAKGTQTDLFAERPDAEHSVRWQPANGDEPAFIPLFEAVRRLGGHGYDEAEAEAMLRSGTTLRTPFAFYRIDETLVEDSSND